MATLVLERSYFLTREREMFYLTTHSTHFIYGYMASDIWLRTILIVRKETRCRHIGFSYRLTARVLLYAPSHRQDNTYHGLCYTSRGALAGTRNSSLGPWRIDPTTHRTKSERSTSELRPAPIFNDTPSCSLVHLESSTLKYLAIFLPSELNFCLKTAPLTPLKLMWSRLPTFICWSEM